MKKRSASAVWQGDLRQGRGSISTESRALQDTAYSFVTRFENGVGTNPEELIAAAHAACFSMALAAALGKAGHAPERIATTATVSLEQVEGAWTITTSHLELEARVPGIERPQFDAIAGDAKANCPVSRVLKANITLGAKLNG
jgi:osmotically inducible protein OsmC